MNKIISNIIKDMTDIWGGDDYGRLNNIKYQLRWKSTLCGMAPNFFELVEVRRKGTLCRISDEELPKGEVALRIKFYANGQKVCYVSLKALKQYGIWDKMLRNMKKLEREMQRVKVPEKDVLTKEEVDFELEKVMKKLDKIPWP